MALYWYDSFQNYTLNNSAWGPWDYNQYGTNWVDGTVRAGTQAYLSLIPGGVAGGSLKRIGVNRVDSYISMAFNFGSIRGSLPTSGNWQTLFSFVDSSFSGSWTDTLQVQLQVGSSGQLRVARGSSVTVLGTSSTNPLASSGWHYVEFYALIDATAGVIGVKVDGVLVAGLQLTSQNTKASANAYLNGFGLACAFTGGSPLPNGTSASGGFYGQDLVVYDSTTTSTDSVWNTWQGDVLVLFSKVAADAGTNQFTAPQIITLARSTLYAVGQFVIDPNSNTQRCTTAGTTAGSAPTYNTSSTTTDGSAVFTFWSLGSDHAVMVKEQLPDDDTSYLASPTVGNTELYSISSLVGVPAGTSTALAVGLDVRGKRDQTTSRAVRTLLKMGGVQADNGADIVLSNGSYQSAKTIFTTNPSTSSAATIAAVNAAQIGFKVAA